MAVVFYVLGLTLGFADNNRYRVLPDVKGDPHVLSPLSVQGVGTAASFRSSPPLARLLYSMEIFISCQGFSVGCASAPYAWQICSASSWLSKAAQLTDPEKADAYLFHLQHAAILEGQRQHGMRN